MELRRMNACIFSSFSQFELPFCILLVGAKEDTCIQNELYWRNPSSNSNSGRPDIGVGNVFLKLPKDQIKTWVEYLDSICVCSSGFPSESMNFSASCLVESKLTSELGWKRQLSRMNVCFIPKLSIN